MKVEKLQHETADGEGSVVKQNESLGNIFLQE